MLITIAIVIGAWVTAVLGLQRLMLFPRYAASADPRAAEGVDGLERLSLDTDEGAVEAFLLPGDGRSASSPGPAVIFAHGNAELIEHWIEPMARYQRLGVTVLLPELRGYGRSAGSPSEAKITEDFIRFHDRLRDRPEVDPTRVVFHGRSLGGGVVGALLRHRRPAALVLQSTFRSVAVMARGHLVPRFLVLDPFDTERALEAHRSVPVLVAHGRRDSIIPFAHAERLAAIPERGRLVAYDDADHNDCPPSWGQFMTEVERFLEEARVLRAAER